jgi:hypothetical protein
MSDQEEARIAASRHFDDLYSGWLVRPSPGNRFLNDRYGSIPAGRPRARPRSSMKRYRALAAVQRRRATLE